MPSTAELLEVQELRKHFGGVRAIDGASFAVQEQSITGLIGPNGAGKSTTVNAIAGALQPTSGSVSLAGQDITGWPSHRIVGAGLVRTFQVARELSQLTVLENLMLAPQEQVGETAWSAIFQRQATHASEQRNLRKALQWLERFDLYDLRDEYAGNLSGGQKKLLGLARALMAEPAIVLLDEHMAGVNPSLAKRIQAHLQELRDEGTTFLLIEHNLGIVESLCDHVVVMANGSVLAEGTMDELRGNEDVVAAYLGG